MKILYVSLMILYFNLVEPSEKYNALIFDPATRSLIQVLDELPDNAKCGDWATTCPAENMEDKNFNEKKSYYKNALFVRTIYTGKVQLKDLRVKVCDQPFKLSIVIFEERSNWYYEFGYDIYFDKSYSENIGISDKRKYTSLNDILNFSHLAKNSAVKFSEIVKNAYKISKGKEIPKKQDKEKGFTWIPLFKVKFWPRKLRRIEYIIRENNKQPMVDCQDYALGIEMFNNIDVDEFYSKEVQEKTFKNLELPKQATFACKTSKDCLEKWLLIPADQFQFGSNTLPSCSIMTTIPIWSNIKDILKKVDEYLYTLSRVSRTPLRIISGVHKHLKLTRSWGVKKAVILETKKFPLYVPRIIYKIVGFKVTYGCEKTNGCWYGAMIVIHNDPDFNGENQICFKDKSKDWGWEDITEYKPLSPKGTETKSKYIYVCPVRNDTMEFVGLKLDYKEMLITRELSLKKFPFASLGKPIKFVDVKKIIDNELNPSSSTNSQSKKLAKQSVIERPLIDNNDFTQQVFEG